MTSINKRAFEFSFGWIFSLFIGAAVIALAFYAATEFIGSQETISNTEVAQEISTLLNPISSGLSSGKTFEITTSEQTSIFNECDERGNFGKQIISVSGEGNLDSKSTAVGLDASSNDKYVFSENLVEGRNFRGFSQPFYYPFRIGDLIYLISKDQTYCFVSPPEDVEEDIRSLRLDEDELIRIVSSKSDCQNEEKEVCFFSGDCEVEIDMDSKLVKKEFDELYFEESFSEGSKNALLFGAIFSSKEVYECQVKRLLKRGANVASLLIGKVDQLGARGCSSSNLKSDLFSYSNYCLNVSSSKEVKFNIFDLANNIEEENDAASCKIY